MVVTRANIDLNRCDVEQYGIKCLRRAICVPSTRDEFKALPTFREPGRVERPDMLPSLTMAINDPGGGKDLK